MTPDLSQPLIAIPALFAGGVLTSLNPCIYPMIPITAAIVGGQEVGGDPAPSRWRPVLLTLSYVLGLQGPSIAVDTAAIAHALDRVYHRPALVSELTSGRR